MFTPKSAIPLTDQNRDKILVSGVDENGHPVNAPLVEDAALAESLRTTPPTIPNPAYQALEQQAFQKAQDAIAAQAALLQ